MFFYSNGNVKQIRPRFDSFPQTYMTPPATVLAGLTTNMFFRSKEGWGDYTIRNDTIVLQIFGWHNDEMPTRRVYESWGLVINDSTIEIHIDRCVRTDDTIFNGTCRLHYYPTTIKPDSNLVWFNKKRWYRDHLHNSRKTN